MTPLAGRAAALLILPALLLLAGCAPEPPVPDADSAAPTDGAPAPTPSWTATTDPVPSGAVLSNTVLPTGCEEMLDDAVLAQLEGIPLGDPSYGPSGVLPDRSVRCVWAEPGAQTTRLITTINYAPEQPVLDYLNVLMAEEDFVCYEPQGGLRCEATWENPDLPVPEGRTLFYRDGVLIDTQYSNLVPDGYTSAVIESMWPDA